MLIYVDLELILELIWGSFWSPKAVSSKPQSVQPFHTKQACSDSKIELFRHLFAVVFRTGFVFYVDFGSILDSIWDPVGNKKSVKFRWIFGTSFSMSAAHTSMNKWVAEQK